MKWNIPQLLIMARFLMAPVMLITAWNYQEKATWLIVFLLYLGFMSDVFDGIIARQQGISSAKLRRIDSQVDMIFWLSAGFSLWFIAPEIILRNKGGISLIFIMEASCYLVSLLKFGKETCTHAWLSKFWGITLLVVHSSWLMS